MHRYPNMRLQVSALFFIWLLLFNCFARAVPSRALPRGTKTSKSQSWQSPVMPSSQAAPSPSAVSPSADPLPILSARQVKNVTCRQMTGWDTTDQTKWEESGASELLSQILNDWAHSDKARALNVTFEKFVLKEVLPEEPAPGLCGLEADSPNFPCRDYASPAAYFVRESICHLTNVFKDIYAANNNAAISSYGLLEGFDHDFTLPMQEDYTKFLYNGLTLLTMLSSAVSTRCVYEA